MKNKFKPKKLILTAGPSISYKEKSYVLDAVTNGWNNHWNDYIKKFEKKFAEYIGVKYAISTSGGTGALQLALASLGIKNGDEIILPDITYFACSDVIKLIGAIPVFVDILKDTWCIDPKKIESAITKKTKAIMPVHLYGNLCDMDVIQKIAKKYKLFVIEDACPAIGSKYKKKSPGSFGDFGAFSFQGAKIMVTGTGGMLVTDNKHLYEKAEYLNNHGEDPKKKFWQTHIGYSTEMSNIQAALGLGQLERIEKLVAKKRQIFLWYKNILKDIPNISMNYEQKNARSNFWMTTIILNSKKIDRDELIVKLRERLIDSRPFFYPISMFPMYKKQDNPVSFHVGLNGINLPSGLNLKKEEVEYVALTLKELLK
jgi:perosamine synthetase